MSEESADVVIIGASLAGCTAAVFLGRMGLKVHLVERESSAQCHKPVCTHLIQNAAVPTLRRMGVLDEMLAAGAQRTALQLWTRGHWIRLAREEAEDAHGPTWQLNLRREKLDPMVRDLAVRTPGVTLHLGTKLRALVETGGEVRGVQVEGPDGQHKRLNAKLVVGADGRSSRTAQLAGILPQSSPNIRGGYAGYFRNVKLQTGTDTQFWILEPDVAYAFPTDDGLVCLALTVPKAKLPEFKRDVAGYMRRRFETMPNPPDLRRAEQVGRFDGMLDAPNLYRRPSKPGLALVGDAALTTDFIWGVGCSWAFRSGELLAQRVGPALAEGAPLAPAVQRYVNDHAKMLLPTHRQHELFSDRETLDPMRRFLFTAAAHDPTVGRLLFDYVSLRGGQAPVLLRALYSHATRWARRHPAVGPRLVTELAQ